MPCIIDWLQIKVKCFDSTLLAILISLFGMSNEAFFSSKLENKQVIYNPR